MHDYVVIDSTMILSSIPSILKPMEDTETIYPTEYILQPILTYKPSSKFPMRASEQFFCDELCLSTSQV